VTGDRSSGGAPDAVVAAIAELRRGRMALVLDDENRENEGDLIMAAEMATPEALAFMIRHTTGLVCVAMPEQRAAELDLPLMVNHNNDPRGTAFTVSVDLKQGTTTGVSAADRALTARALADSTTGSHELSRPGHVFPLRARPGGVLERRGHTESAVDLCRLAGLQPVGVLAEVINDDGTMSRRPQLRDFASEHALAVVTVADIVRYRARREASGRIPTRHGEFTATAFRVAPDGSEHVALVLGDVDQSDASAGSPAALPVLTRMHSECLTGDVFGSMRCDCAARLAQAMAQIGAAGRGVLVYLRAREDRGVRFTNKLLCRRHDDGLETVGARLGRGQRFDGRDCADAAWILQALGVGSVILATNDPADCRSLRALGLEVNTQEPLGVPPDTNNTAHLNTSRCCSGHPFGADVAL
jgi:3,4-dihydroxy 2-butanone 4-phosphate synthase/GTP cyclohydrolase II